MFSTALLLLLLCYFTQSLTVVSLAAALPPRPSFFFPAAADQAATLQDVAAGAAAGSQLFSNIHFESTLHFPNFTMSVPARFTGNRTHNAFVVNVLANRKTFHNQTYDVIAAFNQSSAAASRFLSAEGAPRGAYRCATMPTKLWRSYAAANLYDPCAHGTFVGQAVYSLPSGDQERLALHWTNCSAPFAALNGGRSVGPWHVYVHPATRRPLALVYPNVTAAADARIDWLFDFVSDTVTSVEPLLRVEDIYCAH